MGVFKVVIASLTESAVPLIWMSEAGEFVLERARVPLCFAYFLRIY